jgi:hypothetical protein
MKKVLEYEIWSAVTEKDLLCGLEELRRFLVEASHHGYGTEDAAESSDGGVYVLKTFTQGRFEFKDQYVGGDPSNGHEWVKYDGKVVWSMIYRGLTKPQGYWPLHQALQKPCPALPVRGPKSTTFTDSQGQKFFYKMKCQGNLLNFIGQEEIADESGEIAHAYWFMGGLANLK